MEPVSQPRGRNEVRPEHAGRRVSFQYELPNGYVTEVVGELKMFDEAADAYIVVDKHDRMHRIPRLGVRAGRIVTPPPAH